MTTMDPQLFAAIHDGDINAVMQLLDQGADLTATDSHGETALQLAFDLGHEELARILSAHGAGQMADAYAHRQTERLHALETLGLDAHEVHMRMKGKECFVCRAQMNYARMYINHKKFCERHDEEGDERLHAIETINGM